MHDVVIRILRVIAQVDLHPVDLAREAGAAN